jgi:hypothetical protein
MREGNRSLVLRHLRKMKNPERVLEAFGNRHDLHIEAYGRLLELQPLSREVVKKLSQHLETELYATGPWRWVHLTQLIAKNGDASHIPILEKALEQADTDAALADTGEEQDHQRASLARHYADEIESHLKLLQKRVQEEPK